MHLITGDNIPKNLREIPHPPKKLYVVGTLPDSHYIYVTVVGSRNHTSYGRDVCQMLIRSLANYPVVIVSGLASGIDRIAHETALEVGLPTIAFPGSGLDPSVLFPRSNLRLARQIVDAGGCLVSEFEPTARAMEWTFPQRNRLMAGISRATLIIEAAQKSGTLITAKLAGEYNRDLLVVPGPITSPTSEGSNMFLGIGATPITSIAKLLEALGFDSTTTTEYEEARREALSTCSPSELQLLTALAEPLERDDLALALEKPIHEINITITIMELKGLIKEEYGKIRRV